MISVLPVLTPTSLLPPLSSLLSLLSLFSLLSLSLSLLPPQIAPASGLVSILKRRASLEEANSSRAAPNPKALTKRKVRFREPDDGFDQGEPLPRS